MGRSDSRRRRGRRRTTPALADLPARPGSPSPSVRRAPRGRRDATTVLRTTVVATGLAAMAAYAVGLANAWWAGGVTLVALVALGLGEALFLWREGSRPGRSAPSRPLLASPGPMTLVLAVGGGLCGVVLAARADPVADDLGSPTWLMAPLSAVSLMAMAWLLGLVAAMLVVAPLAAIGSGVWSLVRGGSGWPRIAIGLWFLAIVAYPTCLSLAGDGPRRSLGIAPLLGLEGAGWTIDEPGLLWPARALALLVWGPVVAVVAHALVSLVRSRPRDAPTAP